MMDSFSLVGFPLPLHHSIAAVFLHTELQTETRQFLEIGNRNINEWIAHSSTNILESVAMKNGFYGTESLNLLVSMVGFICKFLSLLWPLKQILKHF